MNELKDKVLGLLKEYPTERKKAALLRFEREHPRQVTPEEILESMVFAKGEAGGLPAIGHISDRTYHIAVNYQDQAARLNREEVGELTTQLDQLERKLDRLEYCVSQLPEEQAIILRRLYFEGQSQKELVDELHLSESTLQRRRDKAVDALSEMYLTLQQAGVKLEW